MKTTWLESYILGGPEHALALRLVGSYSGDKFMIRDGVKSEMEEIENGTLSDCCDSNFFEIVTALTKTMFSLLQLRYLISKYMNQTKTN